MSDREPLSSMVMVDAQTVKGGRTIGTKRTLLVEILDAYPVASAGNKM